MSASDPAPNGCLNIFCAEPGGGGDSPRHVLRETSSAVVDHDLVISENCTTQTQRDDMTPRKAPFLNVGDPVPVPGSLIEDELMLRSPPPADKAGERDRAAADAKIVGEADVSRLTCNSDSEASPGRGRDCDEVQAVLPAEPPRNDATEEAKEDVNIFLRKVEDSLVQKANTQADEVAAYFVRLKLGKNGKRTWDPPQLDVPDGTIVRFSWLSDSTPGIYVKETDSNFQPLTDGSGFSITDEDGDRKCVAKFEGMSNSVYVVCEPYTQATCRIDVCSAQQFAARRFRSRAVLLALLVLVPILAVYGAVMYLKDAEVIDSMIDCSSFEQYCGTVRQLKDLVFDTILAPWVLAVMCFVLVFFQFVFGICIPRPTLRSFGQGYDRKLIKRVQIFAGVFLVFIPLLLILFDWGYNRRFTAGIDSLLQALQRFLEGTLNDAFVALLAADDLVAQVKGTPLGANIPDTLEKVELQVVAVQGMVQSYARLGIELLRSVFTVRMGIHFWSLLLACLAFSYGTSGIFCREPSLLRKSVGWTSWSLILQLLTLGIHWFHAKLWSDTLAFYVDDGKVVLPSGPAIAGAASPLGLQIISFCYADNEGVPDGQLPVGDLLAPLNASLGVLGEKSCEAGHCLDFGKLPMVTGGQLIDGIMLLVDQVRTFAYWIGMPDTNLSPLGVDGLGVTRPQLKAILDDGIEILDVGLSFLKCEQIKPFLEDLLGTLDREVNNNLTVMALVEGCLVIASIFWCCLGTLLARMFERPRKFWYDPETFRWFRFRYSFKVAKNLRDKHGLSWLNGPHGPLEPRVPATWNDWEEWMKDILLDNTTVMIYVVFLAGLLMLSDQSRNPQGHLMYIAATLLFFSTPCGLWGSFRHLGHRKRKAMRLTASLLAILAVLLLSGACYDNVDRLAKCVASADYVPGQEGPLSTQVYKCAAGAPCKLMVVGSDLKDENRLLAVPQDSGAAPDCKGRTLETSKEAGVYMADVPEAFGRRYSFPEALKTGTYVLCWCNDECTSAGADYSSLGGSLFVGKKVEPLQTCGLSVLVGYAESIYFCVSILIVCVPRFVLGLLTLSKHVYESYISEHQRAAIPKFLHQVYLGVKTVDEDKMPKKAPAGRGVMTKLEVLQDLLIIFVVAVVITTTLIYWSLWFRVPSGCYQFGGCSQGSNMMGVGPAPAPHAAESSQSCNLVDATCLRRVDEAVFATSHNVMSNEHQEWMIPNNYFNVQHALDAGVRGLMLDVWYNWEQTDTTAGTVPSDVYLCHGACAIGRRLLKDDMAVLKKFLDEHPRELVILIFEQYVSSADLWALLRETGIDSYMGYYHPDVLTPWPTVGDLISQNNRVLVFSDKRKAFPGFEADGSTHIPEAATRRNNHADPAQWHYMWDFMTETKYEYTRVSALAGDCALNRGAPAGGIADLSTTTPGSQQYRLTILNHFVTNPVGNPRDSKRANALPFFSERMKDCRREWQHQVNFATVDFWSQGDVVDVARVFNKDTDYTAVRRLRAVSTTT
eukprot:TRINITY_DN49266_c0_g1_i1.p1 TRINITY_DN49266_c0_g1~~TRINITY_DN49266_c0_g1_i1.p1  ORF type:complete len:1514 (+),score=297.70 TRINITY_DN49266_c0_g1_i1:48-4544(+)